MAVMHMNSVKMEFFEDTDIAKKGEIINVSTRGDRHLQYVKAGIAKIIDGGDIKKTSKLIKEKMEVTKEEALKVDKKLQNLRKPIKEIVDRGQKTSTKIMEKDRKRFLKLFPDLEPIGMEPVLNDNEPKWLIIYKKHEMVQNDDEMLSMLNGARDNRSYDMKFNLEKQGLWICTKCGAIIQNIEGQPTECWEKQGGCGRTTSFKVKTKRVPIGVWRIPIWKDGDVDVYDLYDSMNVLMHDLVVFPEEIHYKIIILWILSTWKLDCWETVGFPVFRGIIGSGKTRALNIIDQLAYRNVACSSATFSAIARLSHYWHVSLTIDEANNKLNKRTERGAELLDFIKQSYKKGSKYISSDLNDQEEVRATNNFGFKAFAGERSFDPALVSRGIDIFMEKSNPIGKKLEYFKDDFDRVRSMLLDYRYKISDPPDLGEEFELNGRTREVYESIIATGRHMGQDVDDVIEFAKMKEAEAEEDLQGTIESEILQIIKNKSEDAKNKTLENYDAPEKVFLNDICEILGWTETKQKQRIGYILKNMDIKTKRTREGRTISIIDRTNSKRLGYLYRRYKVE